MSVRLYTDEELAELRTMPKQVANPRARWSEKPKSKPGHRQRSYQASALEDEETRFSVYQRQNLVDESDFSCGIVYHPRGGPSLTLARYNGPGHVHGDISYLPHIHSATEKALAAGKKAESEAEATDNFQTLEGALATLIRDFNLRGINATADTSLSQLSIFEQEKYRSIALDLLDDQPGVSQ